MKNDKKLIEQVSLAEDRAALYLIRYTDSLKPVKDIMEANGLLTAMLSDVLEHEGTKGISEKSKAARGRILRLMEIVYEFSKIDDNNKALRLSLTDQMNQVSVLEDELNGVRKAWSQTT